MKDFWKTKVRMTCEEKLGKCHHEVGDTFVFKHAMAHTEGLCFGAYDPARHYISHCAAGVPLLGGGRRQRLQDPLHIQEGDRLETRTSQRRGSLTPHGIEGLPPSFLFSSCERGKYEG